MSATQRCRSQPRLTRKLKITIANRKFLRRTVRYLADEAGVGQFLDIGTGLPTSGNVHEVAQDINPACHVVYSDNDPMVLAHSRALKTGEHVAVIQADLRNPRTVLTHPNTGRLLDFSKPLAVLFVAVLHFISEADNPAAAVAAFHDVLAPGSYLVLSHVASDVGAGAPAQAALAYKKSVPDATLRSQAEILRFFDGFDLLEPGLVQVPHWRPDGPTPGHASKVWLVGGVGRKPD